MVAKKKKKLPARVFWKSILVRNPPYILIQSWRNDLEISQLFFPHAGMSKYKAWMDAMLMYIHKNSRKKNKEITFDSQLAVKTLESIILLFFFTVFAIFSPYKCGSVYITIKLLFVYLLSENMYI